MQAAWSLVIKTLLRSAACNRGSISSASQFRKQSPAVVDRATYDHSAVISSSSLLSRFQIVLGVATLGRGGWRIAAAAAKKHLGAEQQLLLIAVPRRFTSKVTASKAGQEGQKWRFSAIILFLPCAATFGLGTWQLFRRQRKIEVLDYRRRRLDEEPIPFMDAVSGSIEAAHRDENISSSQIAVEELEFRRVICEGVYDVKKNLYVGPRARSAFGVTQKGYFVITPLLRTQESKSGQVPVLVNRGWVPSGWVEEPDSGHNPLTAQETTEEKRPWWQSWMRQQNSPDKDGKTLSSIPATVTVQGVIRGSEEPNMFVPLNVPSTGQWFYIDVPAMARTLGLPENAILIEVMKGPNKSVGNEAFPIAKDPEALLHASVMPQDHVNYALTWYSLSAATTFMAVKRVWGSPRKFR